MAMGATSAYYAAAIQFTLDISETTLWLCLNVNATAIQSNQNKFFCS